MSDAQLNKEMGCKSPRCRRCKCRDSDPLAKVSHWVNPRRQDVESSETQVRRPTGTLHNFFVPVRCADEYSFYFARKGYSLSALELADANIAAFRAKMTEYDSIDLVQGNALDLSRYDSNPSMCPSPWAAVSST